MLFDMRTAQGILFWSNLFLALIVITFTMISKTEHDKIFLRDSIITRVSFTFTFFIILLSDFHPYAVMSNVSTSFLFFSLYLDARLLLFFLSGGGKKRYIILKIILITGIIVFNVLEIFVASETISTIASTGTIIALYCVPAVLMMNKANSGFKRAIGYFYIFFIITLFPRLIISIDKIGSAIFPRTVLTVNKFDYPSYDHIMTQSAAYLALVVISIIGTIVTLLFIKEKSDIRLENLAMNDQLTQIPNRRSFYHYGNILFLKCQREKRELSLMFMDIDHFKKVNDGYGHDFGDIVLKRFALVLKESARQYDLLCRYGGEEFLVTLQSDEPKTAQNLAQRIMERLKTENFDEHPDFKFTVSVGIMSGIPGNEDSLDGFIKNADTALYEAKNNGRNRIEVFNVR